MQITRQTESAAVNAFSKKLEDRPGGITVGVAALVAASVLAGTVVGKDSGGIFQVLKSAKLQASAANNATTYKLIKGHNFKVGDVIGVIGGAAYAITAIDTSNTDYDQITIGTTLGVAFNAGDVLTQCAAAVASGATAKYVPYGLVGTGFDVVPGDNHTTDCIVRGTAIEANIPPIHAAVKALLPLIRFE